MNPDVFVYVGTKKDIEKGIMNPNPIVLSAIIMSYKNFSLESLSITILEYPLIQSLFTLLSGKMCVFSDFNALFWLLVGLQESYFVQAQR